MTVSSVSVSYAGSRGPTVALREVSLSLDRGCVTMLVGPSGSGKSSLLSVMAGLLSPTSGEVKLDGQSLYQLPPSNLVEARLTAVGLVFQTFRLLPFLNVEQNVALPLELRGIHRSDARLRARDVLERISLGAHVLAMPSQLSGGERQRVAIARAVVGRPAVLLADEPTANLDHANSILVAELIEECAQKFGCAVLIVTHDQRLHPYADSHYELVDGVISMPTRTHVQIT